MRYFSLHSESMYRASRQEALEEICLYPTVGHVLLEEAGSQLMASGLESNLKSLSRILEPRGGGSCSRPSTERQDHGSELTVVDCHPVGTDS